MKVDKKEKSVDESNIKKKEIIVDISGNVILRDSINILSPISKIRLLFQQMLRFTGLFLIEDIWENNILVEINESVKEVEIEYETPAPQAFEEATPKGKKITIIGPETIHYKNVLAYTILPREVPENAIKLYRTTGGVREQVQIINFTDMNNNSLIDYIEWIVPELSNQSYELVIWEDEYLECLVKTSDNVLSKLPREEWTQKMLDEERRGNAKQGYIVLCKDEGWEWGNLETDPKRFAIVKILKSEFNESWLEPEYDYENPILDEETKEIIGYETKTQRKYKLPLESFMIQEELTNLLDIEYNSKIDWTIQKNVTDLIDKIELVNWSDRTDDLVLHGSSGTFQICTTGPPCNYSSLVAWQIGEQGDIRAGGPCIANITEAFEEAAPSTEEGLVIVGWTTNATGYIKIVTDVGSGARHNGTWGGGYILKAAEWGNAFRQQEDYVRIEGIAFDMTADYATTGVRFDTNLSGSADSDVRISHCLGKGHGVAREESVLVWVRFVDLLTIKIWNNIAYDFYDGINAVKYSATDFKVIVYSNTVVNSSNAGIVLTGSGTMTGIVAKNNLVQGSNTNYAIHADATTSNNLAEDDTSPDDTYDSKDVIFENEALNDFHLASTDVNATDKGADLSSDGNLNFTDDIDSDTRTGTWDIGADEYVVVTEHTCINCSDCNNKISSANSGDTVKLAADITNQNNTCIDFNGKDDITFDCDGYTINGDGDAVGYGVYFSTGSDNNTLRDCTNVSEFYSGIYLTSSDNNTLTNNIVTGASSTGISIITGSSNNILINNTVVNSGYGIYITNGADYNTLTNNTVIVNQYTGITILSLSDYNNLTNNIATTNSSSAIYLGSSSYNTLLINNTGTSNSNYGIYISSSNTILINNTGTSNSGKGIIILGDYNNLTNNIGTSNSSAGIYLTSSDNNTLTNNIGTSNSSSGIYLNSSSNYNILINNLAKSEIATGLGIRDSYYNLISGLNSSVTSGGYGIYIFNASYNNLTDCVYLNASTDVYVNSSDSSVDNIFLNCSYDTESIIFAQDILIRKWYFETEVNDSNGYLENAEINITNVTGTNVFSGLTNSTGRVARQELVEYINTGGTKVYSTPHIVNTSKLTYLTNSTEYNLTIEENVFAWVVLGTDTTPPYFTDNTPQNQTVSYNTALGYDINATDEIGFDCFTVNDTRFKINCSGYLENNTVLGVALYNLNITINDTLNNLNSTVMLVNVTKATPTLTKYLNGVDDNQTITYPQQLNASAYTTAGTVKIYRDGSDVTSDNGQNITLGVAYYTYEFNVTGNQNYSDISSVYLYANITQANSIIYTYLNHSRSNITIYNNTAIYLNTTLQTGDSGATLILYNNGTQINSGTAPLSNLTAFNKTGLYNITTIYTESQNYTKSYETWYVNVTVEPDVTPPSIYLESPANNTLNTTDNTPDFTFNATDETATTLDCTLWLDNGTAIAYGNNASVLNATSTTITANTNLANDDYNWWINCSDGVNTNISEVRNISIDVLKAVYYSVGTNASDLKLGSPTINISSGTVNFSVAQADKVGVGDRINYGSNNIVYISGRNSSTNYSVITATGGTPSDVTDQTVNNITRAFNSLSAAEAGASGASYLSTLDLVTGNYTLNFPCYADGADTTLVIIDGLTTGVNNYIKIYTPVNSSEVGVSQRHNGKAGTGYVLAVPKSSSVSLFIQDDFVRVDGIEIDDSSATGGVDALQIDYINSGAMFYISNVIVHGSPRDGLQLDNSNGTYYVWNNIIYNNTGTGIVVNGGTGYIYSNTIIGNYYGIYSPAGATVTLKNNIANSSSNKDYAGTPDNVDYCASGDDSASDWGGTGNRINQNFSFVNAANKDYHLASGDEGALDFGVDLSGDANLNFTDDIDGETRTGTWDIGADEYYIAAPDTTPPLIYLEFPVNNTINTTDNTPDFIFNATDETATTLDCILWLDNGTAIAYGNNASVLNATSTTITANSSLANDDYNWWINCSDGANTNISEKRNISIDVTEHTCINCSDCNSKISSASSGDIVKLSADIFNQNNTCIEFGGKDNITFDCDGYTINGDGDAVGYGVYFSTGSNNNTLRDCTNVSRFNHGIYLSSSSNNILTNNTVTSNSNYGIYLYDSSHYNTLTSNTVTNNSDRGISFYDASYNNLTSNIVTNNTNIAIMIYESSNNILINNTGTSDGSYGIYLASSSNNILINNTGTSDSNYGIGISTSSNNTLINNIATSNSSYGIRLYDSQNNILINNTATSNSYPGIYIYRATSKYNTLINNTGTSNSSIGIYLASSSSYNNLTSNTGNCTGTYSFGRAGIRIDSSDYNTLADNIGDAVNNTGILISNSADYNTLINNTGSSASGVGIYLYTTSNNNNLTSNKGSSYSNIGIYLNFSSNNILIDNLAKSETYRALQIETSNYNLISGLNSSVTSGGYGIYIFNASYNNLTDCVYLNASTDVYVNSSDSSVDNIFLNCSYDTESVNGAGNNLTRKWYFETEVNDSNGYLGNAEVNITNITGTNVFSGLTNSTGRITKQELIEYINTGGTKVYSTPHIVNTSKLTYLTNSTEYNLTVEENVFAWVVLGIDTTPPYFTDNTPQNQTITYNTVLGYDINATDVIEFDCFAVNDTRFKINCSGYLENNTVLGVALYNLNITINDSTNNLNSTLIWVNVTQETSVVYTYLNHSRSNITIYNNTAIWLNSTLIIGDSGETLTLYNNGTQINSGTAPLSNLTAFNKTGLYNITTIYTESQNYTKSYETWWVNVTAVPDLIAPSIFLESPSNNTLNTTDNTPDFIFNATDETASTLDCTLWLDNGTAIAYGNNASVLNATSTTITANSSLADDDYNWWVNCSDGVNTNVSEVRNISIQISVNNPPDNPSPTLVSVDGTNQTLADLNCSATITDSNNDSMNVSVRWYKNDVLNLSLDYNNSYLNATLFSAVLNSTNTSKTENWTCSLRLYDGIAYSNWVNSTALEILNTLPIVSLTSPPNNNITTNRTPEFSWSGSDVDNDTLTYQINISLNATSLCTDPDRDDTGISNEYYIPSQYLNCLIDNGDSYTWTVRASDDSGSTYGNWATARRINIQSQIITSLPNNTVNFGTMNISDTKNTTTNNPFPLLLQNDGNCLLNITINATDLWQSVFGNSSYFQYKIDNKSTENGSFNWLLSQTNWQKMPNTSQIAIVEINWNDSIDSAEVDLLVTVPAGEGSGDRSSMIYLTSSLAE